MRYAGPMFDIFTALVTLQADLAGFVYVRRQIAFAGPFPFVVFWVGEKSLDMVSGDGQLQMNLREVDRNDDDSPGVILFFAAHHDAQLAIDQFLANFYHV